MQTKIAAVAAMLVLAACGSPGNVSSEGAGASVRPGSIEDFRRTATDRVFFATDSAEVNAQARDTLGKQAAWLKEYGERYPRVTVEGHADERGTREYNLSLGAQRAAAVRSYLVAQGVPAGKLGEISYGKERPEVVGSNEDGYARNRRAITALGD